MEAALAKEKPEMDKARRSEEEAKARKAREATSLIQAQMLETQKSQEQVKQIPTTLCRTVHGTQMHGTGRRSQRVIGPSSGSQQGWRL